MEATQNLSLLERHHVNRFLILLLVSLALHLLILFIFSKINIFSAPKIVQPESSQIPIQIQVQNEYIADSKVVDIVNERDKVKDNVVSKYLSDANRRTNREQQAKTQSMPTLSQLNRLPDKFVSEDLSQFSDLSEIKPATPSTPFNPSNYLPEISVGDLTQLNTQNYAYASFFIRMKRQMENIWQPRPILLRYGLDREFYMTQVYLQLDEKGYLMELTLVKSSGNSALDREALRTVKSAAPYLNPPPQLLDETGMITIPQWSFIISRN